MSHILIFDSVLKKLELNFRHPYILFGVEHNAPNKSYEVLFHVSLVSDSYTCFQENSLIMIPALAYNSNEDHQKVQMVNIHKENPLLKKFALREKALITKKSPLEDVLEEGMILDFFTIEPAAMGFQTTRHMNQKYIATSTPGLRSMVKSFEKLNSQIKYEKSRLIDKYG